MNAVINTEETIHRQKKIRASKLKHDLPRISLLTLAFGFAHNSFAQNAVEEIVVIARDRIENAQSVPVPMSVINNDLIQRDNIVTVDEITQKVPNLLFTASNSRQSSIALRGLGKNASDEARDPSVGVQVDNVPIIWPGSIYTNFVDLDHIELLRGPQGTLQGKNANLGLLHIVTKRPSWDPEYYVEGFVGNRDALQAKVSASGGVIEDLLAYRASFYIDRRDGYIDNLDGPETLGKLRDVNRMGGRFQFLLTPTEDLSVRVIADTAVSTNTQNSSYSVADPTTFVDGRQRPITFSTRLARDHFNVNEQTFQPVIGDPRRVQFDDIRPSRADQKGLSAEINWDITHYRLTSVSAYRWGMYEPHNDGDRTPYAILEISGGTVQARQWSQELQLSSQEPAFGFIDYQVGGFALRTDHNVKSQGYYGADAGAFYASNAAYDRLNATATGRQLMRDSVEGLLLTTTLNPTVTSLSAFAQADIHVNDKATVTVGVRHTREDRDNQTNKYFTTPHSLSITDPRNADATAQNIADAISIRGNGSGGGVVGDVYGLTARQGFIENSQNWLVNPSYQLTDDFMFYFSAAGGEKAGAAIFDSNGLPENARPEKVLDFELGFKSGWFDNRLAFNFNFYDTIVDDFQARLTVQDPTVVSGFRTTTGNVKEIEMRGVEIDSNWNAFAGVSFFFNAAYNDAIYNDFANAPCSSAFGSSLPCDNSGKTIPNAPRVTANAGVDYRWQLANNWETSIYINNAYRSEANMNADLSPYGIQEAYSITNAGIGLRFDDEDRTYNLSLVGQNIFDTEYVTNVGDLSSTQTVSGTQGDARYFGVNFRVTF
jgi:iron complex outermembrane receptor protein